MPWVEFFKHAKPVFNDKEECAFWSVTSSLLSRIMYVNLSSPSERLRYILTKVSCTFFSLRYFQICSLWLSTIEIDGAEALLSEAFINHLRSSDSNLICVELKLFPTRQRQKRRKLEELNGHGNRVQITDNKNVRGELLI